VLQAGVAGLPQHGSLPYFMYNTDLLGAAAAAAQPPPAHMRLAPLHQLAAAAAHPGLSVCLSSVVCLRVEKTRFFQRPSLTGFVVFK